MIARSSARDPGQLGCSGDGERFLDGERGCGEVGEIAYRRVGVRPQVVRVEPEPRARRVGEWREFGELAQLAELGAVAREIAGELDFVIGETRHLVAREGRGEGVRRGVTEYGAVPEFADGLGQAEPGFGADPGVARKCVDDGELNRAPRGGSDVDVRCVGADPGSQAGGVDNFGQHPGAHRSEKRTRRGERFAGHVIARAGFAVAGMSGACRRRDPDARGRMAARRRMRKRLAKGNRQGVETEVGERAHACHAPKSKSHSRAYCTARYLNCPSR